MLPVRYVKLSKIEVGITKTETKTVFLRTLPSVHAALPTYPKPTQSF